MSGHIKTERVRVPGITPHILVRLIDKDISTAAISLDLATGHFTASARTWDGVHRLETLYTLAQEERALWLAELSAEHPPTIPSPENR